MQKLVAVSAAMGEEKGTYQEMEAQDGSSIGKTFGAGRKQVFWTGFRFLRSRADAVE